MATQATISPDIDKLLADAEEAGQQLQSLIDDLGQGADAVNTGDGVMRSGGDSDRLAGLPRLLSVADVAAVFGVSPVTISRWISRGEFVQPVRVGGILRFPADDVLAFISDNQR